MSEIAKPILNKWATQVIPKKAVYGADGEEGVNQDLIRHYEDGGYSKDLVLWLPPPDCLRIEFEDTTTKNHKYILQLESAAKALGFDYCISGHGGKSDYFNIFNIKGLPVNEDNKAAKMLIIDLLLPSAAKDQLDRTNLGWTLSPIIGHEHWKPKYKGAIHELLRGKNPTEQENEYPKELIRQLKKTKNWHKKYTINTRQSNNWVEDFLTNFCCNNELPRGSRHFIIEKNLAAFLMFRKDKEEIKEKYLTAQKRKRDTLLTWEATILKGDYTQVSAGELANYIKEHSLPYDVPKLKKVDGIPGTLDITFTTFLQSAEKFHEKQPFFYDRAKMWWVWNFKKYCYEIVDETDILNYIDKLIREKDFIDTQSKSQIVEALRRVGRRNIPEEPKKTQVQFKSKVVDIKTDDVIEATPKLFFTNPVPWDIGTTEDTPTMDKLFSEWVVMEGLQDKTYINTLFETIAYATLRHQFMQRMFAFTGVGSNGKGCFMKLLTTFIGGDNVCTSEFKMLTTKNFESSSLYRKQLCLFGEVDTYDMNNTNLMKKLTGEDKIRYEFKGKTPFSDTSFTTCFVSTNSLPLTPDRSVAYYRRWLIIDFPHIFPVGKDVIAEIPEIEFNNLAKKCVRICKELYENKKFTNEGSIEERTKRYEDRSNPIAKFIKEECIENPNEEVFFSEFSKKFAIFLKKNRIRELSKISISKMLNREGFSVKVLTKIEDGDRINARYVIGLSIKPIEIVVEDVR